MRSRGPDGRIFCGFAQQIDGAVVEETGLLVIVGFAVIGLDVGPGVAGLILGPVVTGLTLGLDVAGAGV